jgi:hypothetical protein
MFILIFSSVLIAFAASRVGLPWYVGAGLVLINSLTFEPVKDEDENNFY